MPTAHVEPSSGELLQDIAESLLKARKIVVVTGAGISTNSGIPDFRSENGLYSLIQAQFDAAAKQEAPRLDTETRHGAIEDEGVDNRPAKRLRSSLNASPQKKDNEDENIEVIESLQAPVKQEELAADPTTAPESPSLPESKPATAVSYATPRSARHPLSIPHLMTSPLSSPPPDDQLVPPSTFRFAALPRFGVPPSSSPLSSPPPVLFDPYEPSSPDSVSNEHSNTSDSESEEFSAARKLFASSQGSSSGRSTLPNMKGRDLFDVSVWADPVRTQVFYTFATSLRQKIKDAEPTGSHRFISHLRNRGKLVRCYTQNIDQIEEKVGLSTSLIDGPGSRGRFSRRSTANRDQLAKMVDEPLSKELLSSQNSSSDNSGSESATPQTQASLPDAPSSSQTDGEASSADSKDNALPPTLKKEPSQSGVECVFLHGSLESLRCFLCGQVCSWDEENRETSTLTGQQPECPRCAGAAAAREEKGKRALGVGKLRPDIVLYGEEHPSAHLISPIITHDLALYPDMLLILGTSLRVHGLKVMVREFAKTVHSKGGKVVFVNFTKPPESSWGDIIDFWIQWDCDAWVDDLHVRVPRLWREPSPKKPRPPAANPVAMRDSKVTGAYCTLKILKELRRITGKETPEKTADRATNINMTDLPPLLPDAQTADSPSIPAVKLPRPRTKAQRKSAPGALEKPKKRPSTLNPNHGRSRKSDAAEMDVQQPQSPVSSSPIDKSSILNSVKSNPRVRKRKIIDGEEIVLPTVGRRRGTPRSKLDAGMTLPPLRPGPASSPFGKPQPMEPISPPTGPLTSLSPNLCSSSRRLNPFYIYDPLVGLLEEPSSAACTIRPELGPSKKLQRSDKRIATAAAETDAAAALADVGTSPLLGKARASRGLEGQLRSWGSNWKCSR